MLVLGLIVFTGLTACKSSQKQLQVRESESQLIEIRERITTIPKYELDTIFTLKTDTIKIDSVYVVQVRDTVFTIQKERVKSKIRINKNKIEQELIIEPINIITTDTTKIKNNNKEIQTIKEEPTTSKRQIITLAVMLAIIIFIWKTKK